VSKGSQADVLQTNSIVEIEEQRSRIQPIIDAIKPGILWKMPPMTDEEKMIWGNYQRYIAGLFGLVFSFSG